MKMKNLLTLIIILLTSLECIAQSSIYNEGVSLELARERKKSIKQLAYNLRLNIPEKKTDGIIANISISFQLDSKQEIILDFREKKELIHTVSLNGKPTKYLLKNEHLILPSSATNRGSNTIRIRFTAGNQSLNRNNDYLYSLFVPDRARTVFPCFDQPDLKAIYNLQMVVPADWIAVSNTVIKQQQLTGKRKTVTFAPTKPLSTYLFSFVAGKMEKADYNDGKHRFSAYYRETDTTKITQIPAICKQVAHSLDWMEKYTGIPYPFQKYDFIILPGFQFGGMEHAGATLYNERLFLNEHPTPNEELSRAQLIAHETAHMWFGDLVTMKWFNDVWTKEVFANYFAALITEPLFPNINHSLYWLTNYVSTALAQDRTAGTTPIQQSLDNLRNAGLVYNNIIYDKAPIMMKKLAEIIGSDSLRSGLKEYLQKYAYSNADWDDLIHILQTKTTDNLLTFNKAWVKEKGMPTIYFGQNNGNIQVHQQDPYGRELLWPQRFDATFSGIRDTTLEITMTKASNILSLPFPVQKIIPNTDGRGYGLFILDSTAKYDLLANWYNITNDITRQASLMTLFENYQAGFLLDDEFGRSLLSGLEVEKNPLVAQTIISDISTLLGNDKLLDREQMENKLFLLSQTHSIPSCHTLLLRLLINNSKSRAIVDSLYQQWKNHDNKLLSEQDYTNLSYQLALRNPIECPSILAEQRQRIINPDRLRQFDFISKAVTPDTLQCDSAFHALLKIENRRIEPWASSALALLNHPLREQYSIKYIRPALEILQEIQRTGDIFFPSSWCSALLSGHRSRKAYQEVNAFIEQHPDYPNMLKNKILQAAYPLYRINENYRW